MVAKPDLSVGKPAGVFWVSIVLFRATPQPHVIVALDGLELAVASASGDSGVKGMVIMSRKAAACF